MSNILNWAFDSSRNSLAALVRGAGGTKSLSLALATKPYVGVNPEAGGVTPFQLTKDHARTQVVNPAADITVKLPTTGISAGEVVRIDNRASAFLVTVQSSGANAVGTLAKGYIECVALVNAPTGTADWLVRALYDETAHSTTFTNNASGTTGASTITAYRNGKTVTLVGSAFTVSVGGGTRFDSNTDLPAHLRPTTSRYAFINISNNGAALAAPGLFVVESDGNLLLFRDQNSTAWTGGAVAGANLTWTHTYAI